MNLDVEFSLLTSGPGGAEYEVFMPYGGSRIYMISDRECMVLRRNREDALESYVLEDLQKENSDIESIRLVRR